jgi:hypothetical protein
MKKKKMQKNFFASHKNNTGFYFILKKSYPQISSM